MHIPVVVGVLIAVILLVTFSGWFFHLSAGWGQIIVDDVYFKYRILGATVISGLIVTATFFGIAYAIECPAGETDGVTRGMNCGQYRKIRTTAEEVFSKNKNTKEKVVAPGEEELGGESFFKK